MKFTSKYSSYLILLIIPLIIAFILAMGYLGRRKHSEIDEFGKETIGVLFGTVGKYLKVKYEVDGREYVFGTKEPYEFLQDGERYLVKYMSENPNYIKIYFDRPIFSDDFEFDKAKCSSLEKSLSIIRFKYIVNVHLVTRIAFFKENQSLDSDNYIVKYRTDNPKIGYLVEVD